nr:hypothetical protein [Tanacetum cinerariifolium]
MTWKQCTPIYFRSPIVRRSLPSKKKERHKSWPQRRRRTKDANRPGQRRQSENSRNYVVFHGPLRKRLHYVDLGMAGDEEDKVRKVCPSHHMGRDQAKRKGKAVTSSASFVDVEVLAKLMVNDLVVGCLVVALCLVVMVLATELGVLFVVLLVRLFVVLFVRLFVVWFVVFLLRRSKCGKKAKCNGGGVEIIGNEYHQKDKIQAKSNKTEHEMESVEKSKVNKKSTQSKSKTEPRSKNC